MKDRELGRLITVFERLCNQINGVWFLDRNTLLEYVINNQVQDNAQIGLIDCEDEYFEKKCENFRINIKSSEKNKNYSEYNTNLEGQKLNVRIYKNLNRNLICAPDEVVKKENKRLTTMSNNGQWKYQISYDKWYNPPIPYKFANKQVGHKLDLNHKDHEGHKEEL